MRGLFHVGTCVHVLTELCDLTYCHVFIKLVICAFCYMTSTLSVLSCIVVPDWLLTVIRCIIVWWRKLVWQSWGAARCWLALFHARWDCTLGWFFAVTRSTVPSTVLCCCSAFFWCAVHLLLCTTWCVLSMLASWGRVESTINEIQLSFETETDWLIMLVFLGTCGLVCVVIADGAYLCLRDWMSWNGARFLTSAFQCRVLYIVDVFVWHCRGWFCVCSRRIRWWVA